MIDDLHAALTNLAGEDCSGLPRPRPEAYDELVRRGLARVIDTGDTIGWAITSDGRAALRRKEASDD